MHPQKTYPSAIGASEPADGRIDGVLSPRQRLALNCVRARYLSLLGLAQEFILLLAVDRARAGVGEADPIAARAYPEFAAAEANPVELFARTTARRTEGEP